MRSKSNFFVAVIISFCFFELWLFSMGKKQFGMMWSPLIVFLSGLFSGVGFLAFFYKKEINYPTNKWDWKRKVIPSVISSFGIWKCGDILKSLLKSKPIDFHDPTGSDVIPQVGILVERFLAGIFPYQLITSEWTLNYSLYPTYLPLTWMPFILPDLLGIDYRWMSFAVLIVSFFYFFYKVIPWIQQRWAIFFIALIPFVFLYFLQNDGNVGTFAYSIETLIGGYYLVVAMALFSKRNWVRGIALSVCLLSRYSLILWLPVFFFVLFFKEKKSNIFQIGGWIAFSFLAFYIIPFLSKDPTIFLQGFAYHTQAATITFTTFPWQKAGELPLILGNGYGFAIYFYEFMDGTIAEKLLAYRITHVGLSGGIAVLSMLIFYKIKDQIDYRIFLLGTLKIYLVFFYNFIQIPFHYLIFPLVFISLPMMALLLGQVKLKEEQLSFSSNNKK
jgi:hypothetical protein